MVGLLHALPKTPLYERLEKAGRLRPFEHDQDNSKLGTNVMPMQMDYDAMVDGYRNLYQRLTTDENIALRLRNKMRLMGPPVFTGGFTQREGLAILARLFFKGIVPGGLSRIALFLGTLPLRRPSLLAAVGERLDHRAEHAGLRQAALCRRQCGSGRNRAARCRCAQRTRRVPRGGESHAIVPAARPGAIHEGAGGRPLLPARRAWAWSACSSTPARGSRCASTRCQHSIRSISA